jgi:DNA mismatch repair protein MutS
VSANLRLPLGLPSQASATNFHADAQTLEDLNIPGRHKTRSVARMFDATFTSGGRKAMEHMFARPLKDPDEIASRSAIFQYFAAREVVFPFSTEEVDVLEGYLAGGGGQWLQVAASAVRTKLVEIAIQDPAYSELKQGICRTIGLLWKLHANLACLDEQGSPLQEQVRAIRQILGHSQLLGLEPITEDQISFSELVRYDFLFRTSLRGPMQHLLEFVFDLDVFIAVAGVGNARGFTYARALPKTANTLVITQLFHPAIDHPIGNSLSMDRASNAVFLTGANMAGKSTLMKAFGICIYLAHMGFPVPASYMLFSVKDGMYTSINLPDNLSQGHSHFYAEVLRVKSVATQIAAGKDLFVVFDELFKGTNVKDAFDATLSLTEAFAKNSDSFFLVSTHITEVAQALRQRCENFSFEYFPTVMRGAKPSYTYKLADGITEDKQGMLIIENEGIIDLILAGGA